MRPNPLQQSGRRVRCLAVASLLALAGLSGCGPETAWNCDVGDRRCSDGQHQVCVLDHADTTPDGTVTTYVGRWVDRGACP